ncbi:protein tyrosine phosphatase [Pseudarthrobacter sp. NPDC092424]|uniref:protein tyrosine phosphatase n=1 Tax=Pseudarthrobacter sp. NPDC092424 TaxID=3364415 RepID=UPI00382DCC15
MSFFTVLATSKVAAGVLAAGTLAAGGTGVAAASGVLPGQAQQTAHEVFGAPAPKPAEVSDVQSAVAADASADAEAAGTAEVSDSKVAAQASASGEAAGAVDAAGAAALGLCTAYTSGGLNASSEGFSSLVIAAEGEANIESFCTDVAAQADAAAEARGEAAGSGAIEVELPEAPEAPAAPAVSEVDGESAVPAVPAVPAAGADAVESAAVSVR